MLFSGSQLIASQRTFFDLEGGLAVLCPGYENRGAYADLSVNRLLLRQKDELKIVVTDGEGDHFMGVIEIKDNDTSSVVPRVGLGCRPILIVSLGRSGSTVLANCLGQHPNIKPD